jgi:hypothetical protein
LDFKDVILWNKSTLPLGLIQNTKTLNINAYGGHTGIAQMQLYFRLLRRMNG